MTSDLRATSDIVTLVFRNRDAGRAGLSTLHVNRKSVPLIMTWYGSHHAGDNYTVRVDGVLVRMDRNGEPI